VGWRSVLHLVRVAVTHSALGEGVVGKTTATIGGILHRNNAVGGGFALAVLSSVLSSRIQKQERGELVVLPFFVAKIGKYHKIENYFIFELAKKIYPNYEEIFTQKLSLSSQKYRIGIRDPGYGRNLFQIPNPGSKRHRIPDQDPQHCFCGHSCPTCFQQTP
jgi:hypothetical protein